MITQTDIAMLTQRLRSIERALGQTFNFMNSIDLTGLPVKIDASGAPVYAPGTNPMPPSNAASSPSSDPNDPNASIPDPTSQVTERGKQFLQTDPLLADAAAEYERHKNNEYKQRTIEADAAQGIQQRSSPYPVDIRECDRLPDGTPVLIVEDTQLGEWTSIPIPEDDWIAMKDEINNNPNETYNYMLDNNDLMHTRGKWISVAGTQEIEVDNTLDDVDTSEDDG